MPRQINKIECVCLVCGKRFLAWPSAIKRGKAKLCSRACFYVSLREVVAASDIPPTKPKRKSVQLPCEQCGKVFWAPTKEINRGGGKFCSQTCFFNSRVISTGQQFVRHAGEPNEFGCMLWTGMVLENGYGKFYRSRRDTEDGKRNIIAHRFAFEFAHGPIPDGMGVLHRCDENYPVSDITYRRCVNPLHLFIGTQRDNNNDKVAKGRQMKGEKHPFATVTDEIVRSMRRRYDAGLATQSRLARELGMSIANVSHIVRRLTWKHVV